jgi:hypothetical protein
MRSLHFRLNRCPFSTMPMVVQSVIYDGSKNSAQTDHLHLGREPTVLCQSFISAAPQESASAVRIGVS